MKRIFIILFILVAAAQWFVPGTMVWKRHSVLKQGKAYKFQTMPVDPVNPFKGRYVALNFAESSYRANKSHGLKPGDDLYLKFAVNDSGYAHIDKLFKNRPAGTDYLKAKVDYVNNWSDDSIPIIFIKYPFAEYYTEEFKAPRIETMFRDTSMRPELTYAVVKIYDGGAVIETLFLNDRPVEELLK